MNRFALLSLLFTTSIWAGSFEFEGIVKMSNCSASIITFDGMPITAKAIMMTNGHCTSKWGKFIPPNQVVINKNVSLRAHVYDKEKNLHPIQSKKILYATMTDTDLAFYQLTVSYEELLQKYNISPLILDSLPPMENDPVEIISGYWDKGWKCEVDGMVSVLREGKWFFKDSIRFKVSPDCHMPGGSSGSPIVAEGTRRVVGINNTANLKGKKCSNDNPCEIENDEIIARRGVRYGQQTYKIYNCLTEQLDFNFNQPQCDLPR